MAAGLEVRPEVAASFLIQRARLVADTFIALSA